MRGELLPYGQQWIDEDDINAVVNTLKSNYLTTGPKVKEFEDRFAEYVGAKYAVAVSSGTAALHAACFSAGIGPGDEVITTPMTFAASANCILYQGAVPVFADVDPRTYNINVESILKNITGRTKAIIPVDFAGQPVELEAIREIAQAYNLLVIEDAAHALGADDLGRKIGSISDMTEFSLHPVKHITTGEGGVITTNNLDFYEKLILFRTHGITREDLLMTDNEGPWYYEQLELGYNYRITDIQCALGLSQLNKIDNFVARRREIVKIYDEAFANISEIGTPYQRNGANSSWHLYVIKLDFSRLRVDRKEVFLALKAENIGVNVHYIPVYFHPYYQRLGYHKGQCPVAENLYEGTITLPLFPKMTDQDAYSVVQAVDKVISYYRK